MFLDVSGSLPFATHYEGATLVRVSAGSQDSSPSCSSRKLELATGDSPCFAAAAGETRHPWLECRGRGPLLLPLGSLKLGSQHCRWHGRPPPRHGDPHIRLRTPSKLGDVGFIIRPG